MTNKRPWVLGAHTRKMGWVLTRRTPSNYTFQYFKVIIGGVDAYTRMGTCSRQYGKSTIATKPSWSTETSLVLASEPLPLQAIATILYVHPPPCCSQTLSSFLSFLIHSFFRDLLATLWPRFHHILELYFRSPFSTVHRGGERHPKIASFHRSTLHIESENKAIPKWV